MKLNEIKTIIGEVDLKEGVIPVHITMTLEQVISSGKITNSVQTFVIAGLIDMFKNGGPYRWPRELNSYNMSTMSTSSDMIAAVRSLTPIEQAESAQWLLGKIHGISEYESSPGCASDSLAWIRLVIKKQDD